MLLQVPGGPELLIILLVLALLVGIPVVLAGVFLFTRVIGGESADSDEIAELKGRIDELEAELAAGSEAAHNEVTVEDKRAEMDDERPASSNDDAER
ncbi:preprotein translocase subunit TatA [Halolamina salifodinae]|uniref:Sec-independent protein translocase protein TatA n=1 Tax=Halolamina salifodinae TaxID=1202767 RepID=A0A8T4H430_9EURY|nr:preprotein translocase subunit TatA [Halolamina salifodinae]MBP1988385.1 sec-independent protein translocase protein TatA [Halolamina salifodinae]